MTDDPRCLAKVMGDANMALARAFAAATETSPEIWYVQLQAGIPFRTVQARAEGLTFKRRQAFRDRKKG